MSQTDYQSLRGWVCAGNCAARSAELETLFVKRPPCCVALRKDAGNSPHRRNLSDSGIWKSPPCEGQSPTSTLPLMSVRIGRGYEHWSCSLRTAQDSDDLKSPHRRFRLRSWCKCYVNISLKDSCQ
eukprot:116159-Amphidinium_carterae.1